MDVLLICMPFAPLMVPSMGLSLLKSSLAARRSKVLYFTLSYARHIGYHDYQVLAENFNNRHLLLGDWLFSPALYGPSPDSDSEYLANVVGGPDLLAPIAEGMVDRILRIREEAPAFVDSCLTEVLHHRPRIVGFSSVFQQQLASLALARRIKDAAPETFIAFGGANCVGIMGWELMRQFPWVDAVVSGYGDVVFPTLVDRVLEEQPITDLPGVLTRSTLVGWSEDGPTAHTPPIDDLDALPFPDFDDYFEQWDAARLDTSDRPEVVFETSRGCWWAQIKQCTFCGVNHKDIAFRSKTADRARRELDHLVTSYPVSRAVAVDAVLDMKYFNDLLPDLAEHPLHAELFYNVRPDLKKWQIKLLRDAGVLVILPGLENLSSQVLELMHKGVTGLQVIQHLKWCREYGVRASWLFLWGFPGESPHEYARMAEMIPWLVHFDPPSIGKIIRIDRFSPYFNHAEAFGIDETTPFPAYRHIYRTDAEAMRNLAYCFDFSYKEHQAVAEYTKPVAAAIEHWKAVHHSSSLVHSSNEDSLLIWDFRPSAQTRVSVLKGIQRSLYLECDGIRSLHQLQELAHKETGRHAPPELIEEQLHPLLEKGLMIREGDSFLALAVPARSDSPGGPAPARPDPP